MLLLTTPYFVKEHPIEYIVYVHGATLVELHGGVVDVGTVVVHDMGLSLLLRLVEGGARWDYLQGGAGFVRGMPIIYLVVVCIAVFYTQE